MRFPRDEVDLARLFEDIDWLLGGNVPAHEVARRCGYNNVESLVKVYSRHHRRVPPQLETECYWRKYRKQVGA